MSTFTINKIGKNVQIIEQGEIYREYFEDSANVEIMYNTSSNRVTINIKGSVSLSTLDVTEGGYLFMEGVEVLSYASFLTQYALVFLNGGSGPGSTPTLQQVLNEGYQTNEGEQNFFIMQNVANGLSMTIDGNEATISQSFNDGIGNNVNSNLQPNQLSFNDFINQLNANLSQNGVQFVDNANNNQSTFAQTNWEIISLLYGSYMSASLSTMQFRTMIPGVAGMLIGPDKIQQQDLNQNLQTEISFAPKNNNQFLTIPDQSGFFQVNSRKLILDLQVRGGAVVTILEQLRQNIPNYTITKLSNGVYRITFDSDLSVSYGNVFYSVNENFQSDYKHRCTIIQSGISLNSDFIIYNIESTNGNPVNDDFGCFITFSTIGI